MGNCCFGLLCQYSDFIRNNRKSFSCLSRSGSLNGCVQSQKVRLSGNIHDWFGKNIDLIHNLNIFECFGQALINLLMNRSGTSVIFVCIFFDFHSTFPDLICLVSAILRSLCNTLRSALNLMWHCIYLFRRCRCLLHTCRKLLRCRRYIFNLII